MHDPVKFCQTLNPNWIDPDRVVVCESQFARANHDIRLFPEIKACSSNMQLHDAASQLVLVPNRFATFFDARRALEDLHQAEQAFAALRTSEDFCTSVVLMFSRDLAISPWGYDEMLAMIEPTIPDCEFYRRKLVPVSAGTAEQSQRIEQKSPYRLQMGKYNYNLIEKQLDAISTLAPAYCTEPEVKEIRALTDNLLILFKTALTVFESVVQLRMYSHPGVSALTTYRAEVGSDWKERRTMISVGEQPPVPKTRGEAVLARMTKTPTFLQEMLDALAEADDAVHGGGGGGGGRAGGGRKKKKPVKPRKPSPYINLRDHLWSVAYKNNLRKDGPHVLSPIFNAQGSFTGAYGKACTITQWIEAQQDPEVQLGLLYPRALVATAEFFECADSPLFPNAVLSRYLFAFDNGIYNTRTQHFTMHQGATVESKVPCVHYPLFFDYQQFQDICHSNRNKEFPAMSVPTDCVQHILAYQGLSEKECLWAYAMLGKPLFPLNVHEKWELIFHIMGPAGTGKSCLMMLLRLYFPARYIGTLSNTHEKTFGVGSVIGKWMVVGPDLGKKFFENMDQTVMQSMASGELVAAACKGNDPKLEAWSAATVLIGNEHIDYDGLAGQIERRMAIMQFWRIVQDVDTTLGKRMYENFPPFLFKVSVTYVALAKKTRGTADGHLPKEWMKSRWEMTTRKNSLAAFLDDKKAVKLGAAMFVELDRLKKAYVEFCNLHNARILDVNSVDMQYMLKTHGIVPMVGVSSRNGGKPGVESVFWHGVGLLPDCIEVEPEVPEPVWRRLRAEDNTEVGNSHDRHFLSGAGACEEPASDFVPEVPLVAESAPSRFTLSGTASSSSTSVAPTLAASSSSSSSSRYTLSGTASSSTSSSSSSSSSRFTLASTSSSSSTSVTPASSSSTQPPAQPQKTRKTLTVSDEVWLAGVAPERPRQAFVSEAQDVLPPLPPSEPVIERSGPLTLPEALDPMEDFWASLRQTAVENLGRAKVGVLDPSAFAPKTDAVSSWGGNWDSFIQKSRPCQDRRAGN